MAISVLLERLARLSSPKTLRSSLPILGTGYKLKSSWTEIGLSFQPAPSENLRIGLNGLWYSTIPIVIGTMTNEFA
jgi:hypothetical protein